MSNKLSDTKTIYSFGLIGRDLKIQDATTFRTAVTWNKKGVVRVLLYATNTDILLPVAAY